MEHSSGPHCGRVASTVYRSCIILYTIEAIGICADSFCARVVELEYTTDLKSVALWD